MISTVAEAAAQPRELAEEHPARGVVRRGAVTTRALLVVCDKLVNSCVRVLRRHWRGVALSLDSQRGLQKWVHDGCT